MLFLNKKWEEKRAEATVIPSLSEEIQKNRRHPPENDPELHEKALATIGNWEESDLLFEAWLGVYYDEKYKSFEEMPFF